MSQNKSFQEGWNFNSRQMGVNLGAFEAEKYVEDVDLAIKNLIEDIGAQGAGNLEADKLKGFIAEYWIADTFNIDAVLKKSNHRAIVNGSNSHASVDVSTNFGLDYSMKYYATGRDSVLNQAKNVLQSYYKYRARSKTITPMSFEQYIEKYGYTKDMNDLLMSVYRGQGRIIPHDQLNEAIKFLKKKIAVESTKESPNRLAILKNYEETLQNLSDRISDGEGVESMPLTKEEAERIAKLVKEGEFNAEVFGFSLEQLITPEYILSEALKAGYTAAVITLVLQLAPEIYKSIDFLIKNGYLDKRQLQKTGMNALDSSMMGFLRGSIAAALTISCKSGKLGGLFKSITPQTVGALTVLVIDTAKYSMALANGKMEAHEMGSALTKEILISSVALAGGGIGQAIAPELPVVAYMLGSLIGSTVASIGIGLGKRLLLSYCVETGFTCFGIVKQDYVLPESVIEDMGISITKVDRIYPNRLEVNRIYPNRVEVNRVNYETVKYNFVRRGIIGINKVGYIVK